MLIGVDVIENDRFARAMERRPRLVERLFTAREREYCRAKADPPKHFAARFAAKEAVGKALGIGVRSWQDIEITAGGRPEVTVSGIMSEAAASIGAGRMSISLSHCGTVSVAVAAAVCSSNMGVPGG